MGKETCYHIHCVIFSWIVNLYIFLKITEDVGIYYPSLSVVCLIIVFNYHSNCDRQFQNVLKVTSNLTCTYKVSPDLYYTIAWEQHVLLYFVSPFLLIKRVYSYDVFSYDVDTYYSYDDNSIWVICIILRYESVLRVQRVC